MAQTGKVDVFLFEDDAGVTAEAVLHADAARPVVGRGAARLGTNAMAPEIGAELATSRALAALGHRLLELTAEDLAALPDSTPAKTPIRKSARKPVRTPVSGRTT